MPAPEATGSPAAAGPAALAPAAAGSAVIALDVGGTGMKCALMLPGGTIHHAERHPTPASDGPEAVVATILDVATGLAARARADGLDPIAAGVAVPGVIDETRGIAVWSANLGFRDVPLRFLLTERLGLPAVLGHDVRTGGLAEARQGAGRGRWPMLFVAVGTGIAAALVLDGLGYAGANGAAGELGHVVVRPGGPACGCGGHGCLETIASARAVARRYAEAAMSDVSARDVVLRAADGEPAATQVWQETIAALADGLITAQALYDVETIVLGGGLAEAGDALLVPLAAAMRERVTFHRMPALLRAELGDYAGCVGAALLAMDI